MVLGDTRASNLAFMIPVIAPRHSTLTQTWPVDHLLSSEVVESLGSVVPIGYPCIQVDAYGGVVRRIS